MVKYSFLDLTKDVLGKSTEPLTVHEIWLKAEEIGLVSKSGLLEKHLKKLWQQDYMLIFVITKKPSFIKVVKDLQSFI